jgi:hypothetical protein
MKPFCHWVTSAAPGPPILFTLPGVKRCLGKWMPPRRRKQNTQVWGGVCPSPGKQKRLQFYFSGVPSPGEAGEERFKSSGPRSAYESSAARGEICRTVMHMVCEQLAWRDLCERCTHRASCVHESSFCYPSKTIAASCC